MKIEKKYEAKDRGHKAPTGKKEGKETKNVKQKGEKQEKQKEKEVKVIKKKKKMCMKGNCAEEKK